MEYNITPQVLVDREFKYTSAGISGADMWQGLSFWVHKEKNLVLRGNTSTAKPRGLRLDGYFNTEICSTEQLDNLLSIFY
jgi:hypothetical protein